MNGTQKFVLWGLVVLLVAACGVAFHYYSAYTTLAGQGSQQVAQQNNQAAVSALVSKVGQLMVLPTNETPTVATVVDPSLLQSQPFFANAQKGDVVLIYTSAKMAILYDGSMNKIVNVAPITIGSPTPTTASATTSTTTSPASSTKK